jgi:hypothetical protein
VIWVDFGELKQIVDAQGRDRGSRERPQRVEPPPDPTLTRPLGARDAISAPDGTDILDLLSDLFRR